MDSSDSDFILSYEIYSLDSDTDIIDTDTGVVLKLKVYLEYHKPLSIENMVHLVNLLKLLKIQKKIDNKVIIFAFLLLKFLNPFFSKLRKIYESKMRKNFFML